VFEQKINFWLLRRTLVRVGGVIQGFNDWDAARRHKRSIDFPPFSTPCHAVVCTKHCLRKHIWLLLFSCVRGVITVVDISLARILVFLENFYAKLGSGTEMHVKTRDSNQVFLFTAKITEESFHWVAWYTMVTKLRRLHASCSPVSN